jgi:GTP-binding protein EngB required for normal cell division
MPQHEPEDRAGGRFAGELNGPQQNRLRVSCHYIDKLLGDIEHVLHQTTSQSPFPRYVIDVSPAQVRVVEDHIRRLRVQLLRVLDWQHMKPNPPVIPATRAVLTDLAFIDIAIEELRPSYMRGSGAVPEEAVDELNGVVHELRSLVEATGRYLRQELGNDLESRLRKLQGTGYDVALLGAIEEIVTRHGLVEFRPRIASLASRLEDDSLEVALFGRVSSGKSSLLNALLGADVLPVGVNPITAVPTRLRYGPALRAAVSYGDGRNEVIGIEQLASLVTEQGNPGNLRNVVRALIEVPSPRLRQRIVLVDTPGLGSLARRGAAETLAYLPACDLALVLIDAGTTLNDEDIGTLRLLYEAGIPSLVLHSKADLLTEDDRRDAIRYIEEQLQSELGIRVQVHPVSSVPTASTLLDRFFEGELLPRFERARALREESAARKIGALRESVMAALATSLDRARRVPEKHDIDAAAMETRLRLVAGEIGELHTTLDRAWLEFGESPQRVLEQAAERAVHSSYSGRVKAISGTQLSEWLHDIVQEFLAGRLEQLRGAVNRAVSTLQEVAEELGSSEVPSAEEVEGLLRDAPRFEFAQIPAQIRAGRWKWLGDGALRAAIRSQLRQSIGSSLTEQLHLYGRALSQWSEQVLKRMEAFLNSYADAYRIQIQRIGGHSQSASNLPAMESDLHRLRAWRMDSSSDVARKRAQFS